MHENQASKYPDRGLWSLLDGHSPSFHVYKDTREDKWEIAVSNIKVVAYRQKVSLWGPDVTLGNIFRNIIRSKEQGWAWSFSMQNFLYHFMKYFAFITVINKVSTMPRVK